MKTFFKILGIFSVALFCFLVVTLIFLPTLLSTSFGKSFVLNRINQNISGNLTIEEFNLSWLGKQDIQNIVLTDPAGQTIFSAERLKGDFSPFTFLFDNSLRKLSLQNVNLVLTTDSEGRTNLEQILNNQPWHPSENNDPIFIKQLDLELSNTGYELFLKANGQTDQNNLLGSFAVDAQYGKVKKLQLYAENFPVLFLEQLLSLRNPEQKGLMLNLLGSKINELTVETLENDIVLDATSPTIQAHLKGQFKKDSLRLSSKSKVLLNLPKENFSNILSLNAISLFGSPLNNLIVELNFKDLTVPLLKQNSNQLDGVLTARIDRVLFDPRMQLEQATAIATFLQNEDQFELNVVGSAIKEEKPYKLNFIFTLDNKVLFQKKIFDEGIKLDGVLEAGATPIHINGLKEPGKITISFLPQKKGLPNFHLQINQKDKDFFPLDGNIAIKELPEGYLNINEILIPFKASPDQFKFELKAYSKERKNLIEGDGIATNWLKNGTISLDNIEVTTNFDLFGTDFLNTGHFFKGNIQSNLSREGQFAANVQLTGSKQALVKKVDGAIVGNRHSQEIAYNFKADDSFVKGSLIHNHWNFEPLTISMTGQLVQLPIGFLCPLIDYKICQKAAAIFGPLVNGDANLQISNGNGAISLKLQGANGSFLLNGNVKENILYLSDNLIAMAAITPELEKSILKEVVPFLLPIVKAEQPIMIEIDAKKFKLPLKFFSLEEMSIGNGEIRFPSIVVGKQSQLGQTSQIIGLQKNLDVQFTPLYFHLAKNQLTLLRMDMLLDKSFPIATWGNINFSKETLKINVGITGAALAKSFGIKDLPRGYMLQIPIRGTLANPQLDTKLALARISALVAQQKGGAQGKILGTVLEAATGALTSEKSPSPTTIPPWNLDSDEAPEVVNPIKEIEKGARDIIKSFF